MNKTKRNSKRVRKTPKKGESQRVKKTIEKKIKIEVFDLLKPILLGFGKLSVAIIIVLLLLWGFFVIVKGSAYIHVSYTEPDDTSYLIRSVTPSTIRLKASALTMLISLFVREESREGGEDKPTIIPIDLQFKSIDGDKELEGIQLTFDSSIGAALSELANSKGLDSTKQYGIVLPDAKKITLHYGNLSETANHAFQCDFTDSAEVTISPGLTNYFELFTNSVSFTPNSTNNYASDSYYVLPNTVTITLHECENKELKLLSENGESIVIDSSELSQIAFSEDDKDWIIQVNVSTVSLSSIKKNEFRIEPIGRKIQDQCSLSLWSNSIEEVEAFLTGELSFLYYDEPVNYSLNDNHIVISDACCDFALVMKPDAVNNSPNAISSLEISGEANGAYLSNHNLFPSFSSWLRKQAENPLTLFGFILSVFGMKKSVIDISYKKKKEENELLTEKPS